MPLPARRAERSVKVKIKQGLDKIHPGKWDFFTFILVPGTTLRLASREGLLDSNLSVIGNQPDAALWFWGWGIFVGGYSFFYIKYLFHIGRYTARAGHFLLKMACVFLASAVFLPYKPLEFPFASDLHVLLAFLSPVLFMLALWDFLTKKIRSDRRIFFWLRLLLTELLAAALVLWYASGFITSLLEVYVTAAFCGFLRLLERILVDKLDFAALSSMEGQADQEYGSDQKSTSSS